MSKGYECLSRRALIQLNKDYDAENDEALLKYLQAHIDEYEKIRTVERISNSIDDAAKTLKDSKTVFKQAVSRGSNKLIESALDALNNTAKDLASSMLDIAENM